MIITITGKSGSGKSFISEYLCSLHNNYIHLSIDEVGHRVLDNPDVIEKVCKSFNISKEKLTRKVLGNIVFDNRKNMDKLTEITWDKMQEEIDEFIEENSDKVVVLDWILIPKTKYFNLSSLNILVDVDYESRKNRALKRDNIDEDSFRLRDKSSIDYEGLSFDYIIENKDIEKTKKLVRRIKL